LSDIYELHTSGQTRQLRCVSQYFRALAVRWRYFFGFFHGLRMRWGMFPSEILAVPVDWPPGSYADAKPEFEAGNNHP
jgi:hypothetical protein